MLQSKNLRKYLCMVSFCLLMFAGLLGTSNTEKVYGETVELQNTEIYSTTRNFKSQITKSMLTNIKFVEVSILNEKDQLQSVQWYEASAKKWEVSVKKFEGNYKAVIYGVDALKVPHAEDAEPIANIKFSVGKMTINALETKSTVESPYTAINVNVKGVKSTYGVSKVTVNVYDSKDKLVGKRKAAQDTKYKTNYGVVFRSTSLNKTAGTYKFTVEITDKKGNKILLPQAAKCKLLKATGKASASNKSSVNASFNFKISGINAVDTVKSVSFKVWCNDSDKKTYSNISKSSNGVYSLKIYASKHNYHFGKYHLEAVATLKNGKKITVATAQCNFAPKNYVVTEKIANNKKVIRVYNPSSTKNITAEVSSDNSRGADKTVYNLKYKSNAVKLTVNLRKIQYSGNVTVKFKSKSNGKNKTFKKVSFKVSSSQIQKNGWYYEKAGNGMTYRFYYKNGKRLTNLTSVLGLGSSKLRVEVNRSLNTVTVYAYDSAKKKYNTPVIAFTCSVGLPGTPTPKGTFTTDRKHRWKMLMGPSWGQYATHITQGIYFHSVAGATRSVYNVSPVAYNRLGQAASHGCVRLCVRDAKWIYDHCAIGTTVHIYDNASYSGPFGKPATIKIGAGTNYDPTDPAVRK